MTAHLTDPQLLALLDAEAHCAEPALAHLARCSACRDRQQQIFAAGKAFEHLYRSGLTLPPAEQARIRLQQAVQITAAPRRASLPRWSYAAAALLLLSAGLGLHLHRSITAVHAAEVPNSQLTPGMTRAAGLPEICSLSDADEDPTVTPEVRQAVLRTYRIDPSHASEYQIDYLINPQLGGTADVRNLWPEPYRATAWNAEAKDALEAHLHQMVCSRQLSLEEAQREIASDWISAYKRYLDAVPLQASLKKD